MLSSIVHLVNKFMEHGEVFWCRGFVNRRSEEISGPLEHLKPQVENGFEIYLNTFFCIFAFSFASGECKKEGANRRLFTAAPIFFLPLKSNSRSFCFQPRAQSVCRAKTRVNVRKKGSAAKWFYATVETVYVRVFYARKKHVKFYATVEIHLKFGCARHEQLIFTDPCLVKSPLGPGQTGNVWRPNTITHSLVTKHGNVEVSGQTVKTCLIKHRWNNWYKPLSKRGTHARYKHVWYAAATRLSKRTKHRPLSTREQKKYF